MSRTHRFYNRDPRIGALYHPYRQGCMGRCPFCRDPEKEPWILRRRRAAELRREVAAEIGTAADIFMLF